jgi:endoglycosylceramidase
MAPLPARAVDPLATAPYRTDGRWLRDNQGRALLLHGVNMVQKIPPLIMPDRPGGLDATEANRIASWGWNSVRLGVSFAGIMPTKGVVSEEYLAKVDHAIEVLHAAGIHVLVDVHQDLYAPPWSDWLGFPAWAVPLDQPFAVGGPTIGDVAQREVDLGFPLNATRPSHARAWDFFFADGKLAPNDPKGVVGYEADALAALAARIDDHANVMGLEIINETFPGTAMVGCLATIAVPCVKADRDLARVYDRITRAVRAKAGPQLIVWWEVNVAWNYAVPSAFGTKPVPVPTDRQIGFAHHDYGVCGTAPLPAPGCALVHDKNFQNHDDLARHARRPILSTEFGFTPNAADIDRFLTRADSRFLGWQYWDYGNAFGYLKPGQVAFTSAQLNKLVRTYPQATAGTPTSYRYDAATGVMRFAYKPNSTTVATDIFVSPRVGKSYDVAVDGARVTSPPCARHLTLVALDRAKPVRVHVRPGRCEVRPLP